MRRESFFSPAAPLRTSALTRLLDAGFLNERSTALTKDFTCLVPATVKLFLILEVAIFETFFLNIH
jgi:hypothetical protein